MGYGARFFFLNVLEWWWSLSRLIQDVCRCELTQINSWSLFLSISDLQDNVKIVLIKFSDKKRSRAATDPGDRPRRKNSPYCLLSFLTFSRAKCEISHSANQSAGCSYRLMSPSWEALAAKGVINNYLVKCALALDMGHMGNERELFLSLYWQEWLP